MKITELETLVLDRFPNLVYVHIHTDVGVVGPFGGRPRTKEA